MVPYQVISTSKYREALGLRSIPIIPLLGINPSHPVITDRTQFTLLHLWSGKFVITHHQHALWVLDPSCNSVVAALAECLPIIDITCCKDSVYLLRPAKSPIVKLTLHADFKWHLSPGKGLGSSNTSSDISPALDSGSYQMNVQSTSDHITKTRAESLPIGTNTTTISSKEVLLSSEQNLLQDVTTHRISQDSPDTTSKDVAGLTLAGMSIEDRVHRMHLSSLDVESSSIAVQSVLKKKKKKKKKAASHGAAGKAMHFYYSSCNVHIVDIFHFLVVIELNSTLYRKPLFSDNIVLIHMHVYINLLL